MVSIILPVYNREKTIKSAIDSILKQSYDDFELIVVDDGSNDSTKNIVLSINDDRIKYIYQKNAGACVARNTGIEASHGEYIAFHDSDDTWHSDKLEKQMAIFSKEDVQLVFCKLCKVKDGNIVEYLPSNICGGKIEKVETLFGIGTQSMVAKRNVFDNERFDADMPRFQELELLIRLVQTGVSLYCLDEGLVDYYVGEDSISKSNKKMFKAAELILHKHIEFCKKYPRMCCEMSGALIWAANDLCLKGESSYKEYLSLALKYDGRLKTALRVLAAKCGVYAWIYRKINHKL